MTIKSMRHDLGSGDSIAQAVGAVITATTGSPTVNSYASSGITYDSWTWTGGGSFTISAPGSVDVFLVGGGGGGGTGLTGPTGGGGGGGGQYYQIAGLWLPVAGAYTVLAGAGGTTTATGSYSYILIGSTFYAIAIGGGGGGDGGGGYIE